MPIAFQISALAAEPFRYLFSMHEDALAALSAKRCVADEYPGYPCRVSLEDAAVGETLILLPFIHHETASPYRALGPIFVREGAEQAKLGVGEVPEVVRRRLMSVRAYSADGLMRDADVADGGEVETLIGRLFADPHAAYLHLHNARPGCYSCLVERV